MLYLSLVEAWNSVYELVKPLFERVHLYCLVSQLQTPDFSELKKTMHLALARLSLLKDVVHHNLHRIKVQVISWIQQCVIAVARCTPWTPSMLTTWPESRPSLISCRLSSSMAASRALGVAGIIVIIASST